ncbi:uncharacterized protein LOC143366171 [Andrena cerasifolii]|uniref:uncharacterized protein LOC143366171 n=1 Tax=Andrena cerasifolii TaxID=2819439 RepID=UPI0040379610
MRMKLNMLHILLYLLVFQRESRAIKCYQCYSKRDKDCTVNKVDIKYLKHCPPSYAFCRKAVYMYYFTDSQEYITVRECAKWRNADRECYRGRYMRDSYQFVCECKGVGCNRSTRSSSKTTILIYILYQLVVLLVLSPTYAHKESYSISITRTI